MAGRHPRRALGFLGMLLTLTLSPVLPGEAAPGRAEPGAQRMMSIEVFSQDGTISRISVKNESQGTTKGVANADVTAIQSTGPVGNRIDLVFVGDGYTEADLDTFHQHVQSKWEELASVEPFLTYRELFNVWAVDVISRESGVDNDPTQGVEKDTALDSYFFCYAIERLLCANRGRAYSYASQAPAADHVVLLANTTKYGGAGYSVGDMATAAGGNALAGQIVVHELGHSIGELLDEYDYGGPATYTGPEPLEVNATTYTADQLAAQNLKWDEWLGEESPDGGVVGAYEGCNYSLHGIYRPTENSLMRVLNSEFNLPSREAMIKQFYLQASPLTAAGDARVRGNALLDLALPQLAGAGYDITWYVDGAEVPAWADQDSVQLALTGRHRVEVRVVDATPYVRDEVFRSASMTFVRSWTVN